MVMENVRGTNGGDGDDLEEWGNREGSQDSGEFFSYCYYHYCQEKKIKNIKDLWKLVS